MSSMSQITPSGNLGMGSSVEASSPSVLENMEAASRGWASERSMSLRDVGGLPE